MKPKLRIAVTGIKGQVARAIAEAAVTAGDIVALPLGRPDFDLSRPESIPFAIKAARPDVIINTAAYTAVDDAERNEDLAFAVNARGAGVVSAAAASIGAPLIHISTDYVFSGDKSGAYVEEDATEPRSAYGRTKLAGEVAVLEANPRSIVLRTSWVYAPWGKNFVDTMLRLAGQHPAIGVVDDQHGRPTFAPHIATAILQIARAFSLGWRTDFGGVFHMAGADAMSWRAFAEAVFAESSARGGRSARVNAITTADYPTLAARPANSELDCAKLRRVFGIALPGVDAGLKGYFTGLAEPVLASQRGYK